MKKILTAACLVALGGFCAQAATTGITPTIDPATGTYPSGEYWFNDVIVNWGSENIKLNESDSNYDGGYIINIPVLFNGEEQKDEWGGTVYLNARPVFWQEESWGGYWSDADDDNPGTHLDITGFSYISAWQDPAQDGQTLSFTLPANVVLIGTSEDTNAAQPFEYTVGEVEYDDSTVKTYGSDVTFTGAGSCPFITRLNDTSTLAIISNVQEDLSEYIKLTLEFNGEIIKEYDFDVIKMTDGNYAYNFNLVTDSEMLFTYSGGATVTFKFQQELVSGEQIGGLTQGGEFTLNRSFTVSPQAQRYTCTLQEAFEGDAYIEINTSSNLLQNGTLKVTDLGGQEITSGWKTGSGTSATYQLIPAPEGKYGYTGSLNLNAGRTIVVEYTGQSPVEVRIGEGIFTENGVAEYLDPATVTPTTLQVTDTSAVLEFSWGGQEVFINNADLTMSYTINGDPSGAVFPISDYFQFENSESGTPGVSAQAANGESGTTLVFLMGGALNNLLEVGTYEFTFPTGAVKNANGDLNYKQVVTVTVLDNAVTGLVKPDTNAQFNEGEEVMFTITFEGAPEKNTEAEMAPVRIWNEATEYENDIDWGDNLYTEGNNVVINFGSELEPGNYTFFFRAGSITVDGLQNEEIENHSFVVNSLEGTPEYLEISPVVEPDPREDSLEPFNQISLKWEGYAIEINEAVNVLVTFNGEAVTGNVVENVLYFDVEAEEDGQYTLIIPKDYIIATDSEGNEYYNDSLRYDFVVGELPGGDGDDEGDGGDNGDDEGDGDDEPGDTPGGDDEPGNTPGGDDEPGTSGIAGVEADANGLFKVYSINGVNVMTTNDAKALKNLKGIFIINGKKAVIK